MNQEKILDQIRGVFSDIFDVDEMQVTMETTAEDIPDWDSMNQIILIATLEDVLSVHFDMADHAELKSVRRLVEYIEGRL